MPLLVALVLVLGQAQPASKNADPVKVWQSNYERLIGLMKKRDPSKVLALFHKDYSEISDGYVYGIDHVKKQLATRMEIVAQFGQKPIVRAARTVGYTAVVTVDMSYKTTKKEKGKVKVILTKSRLSDTWVRVGKEYKIFRSTVVSTSTTVDGKPFKPPAKSQ